MSSKPIVVGLLVPQSGPYQADGPEIVDGFQLYLDAHEGKLGGHRVKVIIADEGDGQQVGTSSAKKLIEQDGASVLVGTASADAALAINALAAQAGIAFIGTGGRPADIDDITHVWYTSWLSAEPGVAIADHVRTTVQGPVYVIGSDHQVGRDNVKGFVNAFRAAGGELANPDNKPVWTPWPSRSPSYWPYLNKIVASEAKAVYAFYNGSAAVDFVKQYSQAGLRGKIPLFGPGFLTEESILGAQGPAANGVQTSSSYAPDLDNAANRSFIADFTKKYNSAPHLLHVTSYDSAAVLDRALTAAGNRLTRKSINDAIGTVGAVDSPRGTWRWSKDHTPVQTWYLRQVGADGRGRANVVVKPLTTLGRSE